MKEALKIIAKQELVASGWIDKEQFEQFWSRFDRNLNISLQNEVGNRVLKILWRMIVDTIKDAIDMVWTILLVILTAPEVWMIIVIAILAALFI